ncbi:MAG: PIG-L family deacetylase [Saprospiraceae bacterium]
MKNLILLLICLFPLFLVAQKPATTTSADIQLAIKKLNVLGSVLYVAAHPDDENTRLISYLANVKLYDVTYLSLTRGDGGQNLIGPEIRELMGVLRTEELLMARSVDGGHQLFTRANDFGYSKTVEETLNFWNKDEVLQDVVLAYRKTCPDVVIHRFPTKNYITHGHHTTSAILSTEAFELSGRSDIYPEQLSMAKPWQAKRQFFNSFPSYYGDKMPLGENKIIWTLDVGSWIPLKGKSVGEIAAESRSKHRCQGFGMLGSRGSSTEYLDFIQGDMPADQDIFQGINTSWSRVEGGKPVGELLTRIEKEYRGDDPAASVPSLLSAMQMIKALPPGYWRDKKLQDIKEVIRDCLGLYLEATADQPTATPGGQVKLRLECISRAAGVEVVLSGLSVMPGLFDTIAAMPLETNKDWALKKTIQIPENATFTSPYWLREPATLGMYRVDDQHLRGLPETPRYTNVRWSFTVNGKPLEFETDVAWKSGEAAVGEVWRPFEVLPPVYVEFTESNYLFKENRQIVEVRVTAGKDNLKGNVRVKAPAEGWVATSEDGEYPQAFTLNKKGEEKTFRFMVQAPENSSECTLAADVEVEGKRYSNRLVTIKYDHIPQQSVLLPASAHAVRFDLKVNARKVGYYMGAGDDVPKAITQMGCDVSLLHDEDLNASSLKRFDAVVIGVRAYNTKEGLSFHQSQLLEYVKQGGTLIIQYNTDHALQIEEENLAPFSLKLSNKRVTDETAAVSLLLPEHPALNSPNKLTDRDFDSWVQERGLYFPERWDKAFETPLSMHDKGEDPLHGSLLIAQYGKGHYVYTGLSFFRELPAGVPGAFRLFANLLSLGKSEKP